jgi:nucleotide-binding universal stress UspA family protein
MTKIVASVDGSRSSIAMLPSLATLAKHIGPEVEVDLLTVVSSTPEFGLHWAETEEQAFTRAKREALQCLTVSARPLEKAGVNVVGHVLVGDDARKTITDYASSEGADLIVAPTGGRWRIRQAASRLKISAVVSSSG